MANDLQGMRVGILATDGVERIELEEPRGALRGAGAQTEVISIHPGEIKARQWDIESAGTIAVDRLVSDCSPDEYDALLMPGGTVNPDQLRMNRDAVGFVRAFFETGKPIASICHGPWTLAEADVIRGRRLTSWPSTRTDLRNAGAEVVDEPVCIDGQLTTSRSPADLPQFCPAIVEQFAKAHHPVEDSLSRRWPAGGPAPGTAPATRPRRAPAPLARSASARRSSRRRRSLRRPSRGA